LLELTYLSSQSRQLFALGRAQHFLDAHAHTSAGCGLGHLGRDALRGHAELTLKYIKAAKSMSG
jgi:hypothetical protein